MVKLRDAYAMASEALNEYIETLAPQEAKGPPIAVKELTFGILKFETQQGAKLGEFEVAYKAANIADKWTPAYNVLRNSNATIKNRYYDRGYAYNYWLFSEDRIYRQKLKPKK